MIPSAEENELKRQILELYCHNTFLFLQHHGKLKKYRFSNGHRKLNISSEFIHLECKYSTHKFKLNKIIKISVTK